ncbi:MAG: M24 family metallopeptidase [Holosporaceae bacterium]|nr:M24 family metallopeptidase [Holosporaceae bacterium]
MEKIKNFAADVILYRKNNKYPNIFEDPSNAIFKKITGLESSDGAFILSRNKSAVFVDGRYAAAARQYIDQSKFDILNLEYSEIVRWIKENTTQSGIIAYDPDYFSHREMEFFFGELKSYSFSHIDLKKTLNIPSETFSLNLYQCRDANPDRMRFVINLIEENDLDAYLISDPCSIAWILDLRDLNQKYTPVILGHLLVTNDHRQHLYLDSRYGRLNGFRSEEDLPSYLYKLFRVGIDKSQTAYSLQHPNFVDLKNPCLLPKSVKNSLEIEDMKIAARKDSTAITCFLHWLHHIDADAITERVAIEKLLYFRKQQDGFIGESFKTIAAADEHSAMVHYSPSLQSDKMIKNLLLIDSGGQYIRGTTDITRTVSISNPSEEQRRFYTLVLKGHIALADAKFPPNTCCSQLDSLARQFLWQNVTDYHHGTGHGIGYMSHVHEGPIGFSCSCQTPLLPGMILSNEPGYYLEDHFGIRLENMIAVMSSGHFMNFEPLSLVPFDPKLISMDLLSTFEKEWLAKYHSIIFSVLDLPTDVRQWVRFISTYE